MAEPTPPPIPAKRRAGAPRGNRNAFKHGFYSAEVLDLRRRVRAFCRRANAAIAAGNRLARAKTEAEREKARAEVRAAALGEGGKPKTEEQLFCRAPANGRGDPPPPRKHSKIAEQLSVVPPVAMRDPAAPA